MTHDKMCPYNEGDSRDCGWCQLIVAVREDMRDCDAHGDTIRYRCAHYQQGRKDGYNRGLRDAVEAVNALEYDDCSVDWHRDYDVDKTGNIRSPRIWIREAVAAIETLDNK